MSMDTVVARLSAVFEEKVPTKKAATAKKVTSEVKDEDVADALFELEKALSLPNARSEVTRAHQTVLERTILDKVMKRTSAGHMLRELSASCLTKVMEVDSGGLSKVHASLVSLAIGKESAPSLAALVAYGMLAGRFGNQFVVSMTDILLLIMKLMKGSEGGADKEVAIVSMRRIYEGTGGPIKGDGVATDIIKSVARCTTDRSNSVRRLAAECCTAVIVSSDDCRELDILLPAICKCLADSDDEVRYEMAASLGRMLATSIQLDHSKVPAAVKKKRKKGMDIRTMEEAVNVIKALFVKAPNGSTRASLAQSLVHLIQHARGSLAVSDQNVGAYIAWFFSFLTDRAGKSSGNEREGRQSAACIEYAVREGLLTGLNERALEAAGKQIVTLLAAQTKVADSQLNEFQVSVCLEHLSFILVQLGEAVESMDLKDKVSSSFMSKTLEPLLFFLPNPRLWLRIHAAQSVRQLSRAAPTQIANWLSVLYKLVMMQMAEGLDANGEGVMELPLFFSLHGHISALAAIVGVIPESSCGVPVPLIESIFDVCKKLLILNPGKADAPDTPQRVALIEAGWLLLSALIGLGTEWIGSRLNPLFAMWKNCLGKKPKATRDGLYFELKLRAQSLVALRSFVHVFRHRLTMLPGGVPSAVLKPTVAFAVRTFALLKGIGQLEPPLASDSPVQAVISSIKPVLMDIFAALPAASFNTSFVHVLHMVVSEFTAKSPPSCTELARMLNPADSPLDPECYALPIQRFVELGRGDDMTMSNYTWNWAVRPDTHSCPVSADRYGASSTSSSRNGNGGSVGSISPLSSPTGAHAAGLFPMASPTGSAASSSGSSGFGPQSACVSIAQGLLGEAIPYSQLSIDNNCDADLTNARECNEDVNVRAVNSCIRLFASIYLDQSVAIKEQLVKHFLAIIQKARTMEAVHSGVIANISAAILGICKEMAQRDTTIKCAPALDLLLKIASELLSSPSQHVRRAMGEALGILCKIEGDAFIQRVHKVVEEKLPSKDPITVAGAAFTLGCVHRYVGAMRTMRSLTFTVAALQSVSRDFSDPFRQWILHSLWLSIDMGGLTSTSYVQPTLSVLYSHALYDSGVRPTVISQCIGRIIHAVMAALGPELMKPSTATGNERFLSLWRHLKQDPQAAIQVEVVNVLHQLIVWSSPAVDLNQSFPIVQSGIASSDAAVRRTSLRCLRSWAEKDLGLIPRKNLERRLLDMLDNETNRSLRGHIQRCFESLLRLLVPLTPESLPAAMADPSAPAGSATTPATPPAKQAPGKKGQPVTPVAPVATPVPNPRHRLLDVCKKIVVGLIRLPSEAKEEHKMAAAAVTDEGDGNDDDAVIKRPGEGKTQAGGAAGAAATARTECRWRTRVFALECIKLILHVSRATNLRHDWDLVHAQQSKTKEQFIVLQLLDLVTVGTVASGCTYDPLRVSGVQTLQLIINCFENTFDPLSKGQLLLEQYQAQLSTALRQGLSTKADVNNSPQLRVAACHLAVTYLCSGVVTETHGMDPVIKLLLSPLLRPYEIEGWLAQFNGRMRTLVLMSHINALARLHVWGVDPSVIASVTAVLSATIAAGSALNKAVKSHPRTRAQVALRDLFKTQTRTLTNYYFNALKDYAVVSSVPRRALTKLTGGYFEGHLATGIREVFDRDWESLLRVCAMTMEFVRETDPKELEAPKVETPKQSDTKSPQTPRTHGRNVSVAGSPTGAAPAMPPAAIGMPPLTAATLMFGVTTATLHAIITSPTPSGGSDSSSSSSSSSSSRRRKGDDNNDAKWEKERDDKTVIDSLFALETLMQPKFIRTDVVSNETLAEIIPVLGEYIRAAVVPSATTIDQQKARLSLSVVCALVRSLSSLATTGGIASDAIVASTSPASSPTTPTAPFELGSTVLHSLAEILSSIVHYHLPAPSSNTSTAVLVESFTSLSPEASSLVRDVLTILPSVVALRASSREDQRLVTEAKEHDQKMAAINGSLPSSSSSSSIFDGNFMDAKVETDTKDDIPGAPRYLSSALWLCIHVLRVADVELSSLAFTTIGALSTSYPAMRTTSVDDAQHPIEDVVERLATELITIANGYNGQTGRMNEPLPIAVRIRLLLRSLMQMASAATADADTSYTPCDAAWRASLLVNTLLAHTHIHFRMYALEALQSILAPTVRAKASMFFIAQSTPAIIALLQSSLVQAEDGAIAIQFLMALFGRLQDATAREQLLSVVLPLLVARLPVQESVISHFGTLSASFGPVLAQHVALLPTDLRNQLQAYYMRAQQAAQTAAASAAAAAAAEEEKKAAAAAKKGTKSTASTASSSHTSSSSAASSEEDGGIKLGINFSRFKK